MGLPGHLRTAHPECLLSSMQSSRWYHLPRLGRPGDGMALGKGLSTFWLWHHPEFQALQGKVSSHEQRPSQRGPGRHGFSKDARPEPSKEVAVWGERRAWRGHARCAAPGDGLLCPAAQGDMLDTAGARALDSAPQPCRSSPGWSPCHLSLPPRPPQAPGTAQSSSQLPTTLSSWTFPKSGLTTAAPCPTAFHGSPWPSGKSLSAVSVRETTSPTYPAHLLTRPDHFHCLLREGLGL